MAPAGCHTHRHASRETYYNNMIISYIIHATSQLWPYHITCQTLQKQVRRPLIVVASFTWLIGFLARTPSYLRDSHNDDMPKLFTLHKDPFHQIQSD